VKAPQRDDEHHVAGGPEERTAHKARDRQVPPVQVSQLLGSQTDEGHLHRGQREEGQPAPRGRPRQERLPALGHREPAEADVQQRVADEPAEEAGEGEGVNGGVQGLEEQRAGDGAEAEQVGERQARLHPEGHHDRGQRRQQHRHAHGVPGGQRRAGGGEAHQLEPLRRGEEGGSAPGASAQPLQQRPQRARARAGQQQVVGGARLRVVAAVEETLQPEQEAEPQVEETEADPLRAGEAVRRGRDRGDDESQDEHHQQGGVRGRLPPGVEPQAQGDQEVEPGQVAEPPDGRAHAHLSVHVLESGHRRSEAVADTVAEKAPHLDEKDGRGKATTEKTGFFLSYSPVYYQLRHFLSVDDSLALANVLKVGLA